MVLFGAIAFEVIIVGVVLVAIVTGGIYFINGRWLSSRFKVAKAKLGQSASDYEAENAVALMKQGIVECTEQVTKAKSGLVKVQASIAGLERRANYGSMEEARLSARIRTAIDEGKGNDDPVLKQLAASLKSIRDDLKADKVQLESQHAIYSELLGQIGNAQRRAEQMEREAESIGAQLETSKLTAELSEFASEFDAKGVNASLDGVAKYRELAKRQIDANNAKMKVNRDLGGGDDEVKSWEQSQDATGVLDEFRAKAAS